MKLIRYSKPDLGTSALDRLDNLFRHSDRLFGVRSWPGFFDWADGENPAPRPALEADLYEDDDNYHARFELPGVSKDNIGVQLHDAVLTVSGERRSKGADKESRERLTRSISVPDGIDTDAVSARHEDGLLTITMPKSAAAKPRTIKVD